ncbi:MAG: 2-C-methyl-D-erythritol 4-phosphate cytidylyltransferase [Fidelibacterota bacterium]|nr:MAG: 2-C-methyl-D-erythritol 4-phosphate cytidylyltransferase [Candidatus Neomarinimicrobiota bacterium]
MTNPDHLPVAAIIPAAGTGTRFPGETRKQFRLLAGRPLLVHTLERVWSANVVSLVVVAVPEEDLDGIGEQLLPLAPAGVELLLVAGGAVRQASAAAGLEALPPDIQVIVVHDAVRPLFEPRWIGETVALCRDFDGAIVAIPASDTLKEVEAVPTTSDKHSGTISHTIPRTSVWRAQTPQAFRADILRRALRQAEDTGLAGTDEATLVEAVGGRIAVVEGSPGNIKVTTPEDWRYLEWRMQND